MTFEEAMVHANTCGNPCTYLEPEMRALWQAMMEVPEGGTVIEIGAEYGRSTSLILQAGKDKDLEVIVIDPFVNDNGTRAGVLTQNMRALNIPFTLMMMTSEQAWRYVPDIYDLVHIDGDHSHEGLSLDCECYLPGLRSGGIAVFHDYQSDEAAVKPLVDKYVGSWPLVVREHRCYVARKP